MIKVYLFIFCTFFMLESFAQLDKIKDSNFLFETSNKLTSKNTKEDVKATLKIYPNPAKNRITLEVNGFEAGLAVVKITDAKGKIWREDNRLLANGTEDIAMFLMLPPGIYFISISEKTKIIKKKFVVI